MAAISGVELAKQVLNYVQDVHYPCRRTDLVDHAKRKDASPEVIRALERIPEETYDNLDDVKEGLRRGHVITPEQEQAIKIH